jgi:hypothetical protein
VRVDFVRVALLLDTLTQHQCRRGDHLSGIRPPDGWRSLAVQDELWHQCQEHAADKKRAWCYLEQAVQRADADAEMALSEKHSL